MKRLGESAGCVALEKIRANFLGCIVASTNAPLTTLTLLLPSGYQRYYCSDRGEWVRDPFAHGCSAVSGKFDGNRLGGDDLWRGEFHYLPVIPNLNWTVTSAQAYASTQPPHMVTSLPHVKFYADEDQSLGPFPAARSYYINFTSALDLSEGQVAKFDFRCTGKCQVGWGRVNRVEHLWMMQSVIFPFQTRRLFFFFFNDLSCLLRFLLSHIN